MSGVLPGCCRKCCTRPPGDNILRFALSNPVTEGTGCQKHQVSRLPGVSTFIYCQQCVPRVESIQGLSAVNMACHEQQQKEKLSSSPKVALEPGRPCLRISEEPRIYAKWTTNTGRAGRYRAVYSHAQRIENALRSPALHAGPSTFNLLLMPQHEVTA